MADLPCGDEELSMSGSGYDSPMAGSPSTSFRTRRQVLGNGEGNTASGIRKMAQLFEQNKRPSPPTTFRRSPSHSTLDAPRSLPAGEFTNLAGTHGGQKADLVYPTKPLSHQTDRTSFPRSLNLMQSMQSPRQTYKNNSGDGRTERYERLDRNISKGKNNFVWKYRKSSKRRWSFGKLRVQKDLEKMVIFAVLILVCGSIFLMPRIFSSNSAHYSSPNDVKSAVKKAVAVQVKNLTNLSAEQVLSMDPDDRIGGLMIPSVISQVKIGEWSRSRLDVVQPKISLLAACKDRTSMLHESLRSWREALRETDEIILVDWSTSEDLLPIVDFLKDIEDPRIASIRVNDQEQWILSHAYNLAAAFASGEFLLKVDCDTKLDPQFLQEHSYGTHDNFFYRVSWSNTRNENEQHLSGVFFLPRKFFDDVGGYDERIQSYGWDDSDLYKRIEELDVLPRDINMDYLSHIQHEDVIRGADQENFESPMFHTQLNSILVEKVVSWSLASIGHRAEYSCKLKSGDARFVEAVLTNSVPRLEDLTERDDLRNAEKTAYGRVLHDAYGIPWGVLNEIEDPLTEVLKTLQQFGHGGEWKKRGAIFGQVIGSPAQRLLALISMIALAEKHDRVLFLTWSTDDSSPGLDKIHLSSMFDWRKTGLVDALDKDKHFTSRFFPITKLKCKPSPESCVESDDAWKNVASGTNETEVMMVLKGMHEEKHHALLHLDHTLKGLTEKELLESYKKLSPSESLMERVRKFGDTSDKIGVYVGMHMRPKQIVDFAKRLKKLSNNNAHEFVVVGSEHAAVAGLRRELGITSWEDDVRHETETQYERVVREVSELYALGRAKKILNDGRCPDDVHELISLLNSDKGATAVVDIKS